MKIPKDREVVRCKKLRDKGNLLERVGRKTRGLTKAAKRAFKNQTEGPIPKKAAQLPKGGN